MFLSRVKFEGQDTKGIYVEVWDTTRRINLNYFILVFDYFKIPFTIIPRVQFIIHFYF